MQYIDINRTNIKEAKEQHYLFMRYIIKKKLNGANFSEHPPISQMNQINRISNIHLLDQEVILFLNDECNLKKVLIGTPEELDTIKSVFSSVSQVNTINKILKYKVWINKEEDSTYKKYNAYHLAEKLDIPTCVYCNRIYTKTVITGLYKKITRPTFDHWFPKSKYPLLSLSFHNLIPSCSVCNCGVKGDTPFSIDTHFHPYYINPNNHFKYRFSYDHVDYNRFSFKIITEHGDEFSKRSIEAFELEEIFKAHEDEIEDLRKIKDAYSDEYINILESQILGGINLDRDEIYRLAFGVHFQEAKFDRRPLSKMKKDILVELGVIITT
ncbi:hypothetical protein [Elizabethkingia ursingii]|uniref:HNH nuclease domain-containing protein n=1 Tax=Elizabethkingia ursingii TaxID=1756150 RepID=A0ABX3N308_9FLAO|nr:hypothetical protein [Elizabethkingia ursingii]OPB84427.1 hypothetical protein BB021_16935 [Elizabethkingia ursingii]